MFCDGSILAIIPARGGSKGVPRKNIRALAGKPLIAHTIAAAKASRYIDRYILSSDDDEIIAVARAAGCDVPFVRPVELSGDTADGLAVVRHALGMLPERYDYVVNLQPTSPLRTAADIDGAIELCVGAGARACASVVEAEESPYWMLTRDDAGHSRYIVSAEKIPLRRQLAPKAYSLNGAIFVTAVPHLMAGGSDVEDGMLTYVMPPERSVDIDEEADFALAEAILARR